jgi:hypothetical protein
MKISVFNNKALIISCLAVLASLLIAFITTLIVFGSAPTSAGENDMSGIILYFEVELFLRPLVALASCWAILQIANLKQKQTDLHPDNPRLNIAAVLMITFVFNAIISIIQFLYIWH